jgi:hypothetical protein
MLTAQEVIQYVTDTLHMNDDETIRRVYAAMQDACTDIARTFPWQWLRAKKTVTIASNPTQGALLPANLIDVIDPLKDSNGYIYTRIDPALVANPPSPQQDNVYLSTYPRMYLSPANAQRYFAFDVGQETPLSEGTGASIDKDSATISYTSTPTASCSGEFIQFGENPGVFEMTNVTTLKSTYRGPRIKDSRYTIRPALTRRIAFYDAIGNRLAVSLDVNYWGYPAPVFAPDFLMPDHWCTIMKMGTWIQLMTDTVDRQGHSVRAARMKEYEKALAEAKQMDGKPTMQNIQRDNIGRVRRMGWR